MTRELAYFLIGALLAAGSLLGAAKTTRSYKARDPKELSVEEQVALIVLAVFLFLGTTLMARGTGGYISSLPSLKEVRR